MTLTRNLSSKRRSKRDDGTLYKAFQTILTSHLTTEYQATHASEINGTLLLLAARAQQAINRQNTDTDLNAISLLTNQFDELPEQERNSLYQAIQMEWSKRRPVKVDEPHSSVDQTSRGSFEDIREMFNLG